MGAKWSEIGQVPHQRRRKEPKKPRRTRGNGAPYSIHQIGSAPEKDYPYRGQNQRQGAPLWATASRQKIVLTKFLLETKAYQILRIESKKSNNKGLVDGMVKKKDDTRRYKLLLLTSERVRPKQPSNTAVRSKQQSNKAVFPKQQSNTAVRPKLQSNTE